jgi:hypothetical protein
MLIGDDQAHHDFPLLFMIEFEEERAAVEEVKID